MGALLDFHDAVVVITGAASGIGAATIDRLVEADAEIHALDVAPIEETRCRASTCDLGDPASIDAALGHLPSRVDVLLNCAGVPNGGRFTPEAVMRINWLGLRHLTEALLPRMPPGGSVVHVASTAGRRWTEHRDALDELMSADTFSTGLAWVLANEPLCGDGYALSKEAVRYYTMWRGLRTIDAGIRMNSVSPGVTNTALLADFRRGIGDAVIDRAIEIAGRPAEPVEMAPAMLFLADSASSSYINGVNLDVDRGTGAAHRIGVF